MSPEYDLDEDAAARARRQAEDLETALRLVCQPCQNGDHSGRDQNDRAECHGCICPWGPRSDEVKQRKAEDLVEEARRRAEAAEHGRITILAPTNPQVHLLTWYIVNCARCGERWYEDCDGVPGGATEARALGDAIRDWQMKGGPHGKLYCEECFTIQACEAEGHPWGEWWPSRAIEFPDREVRYCPRCDDVEVRVVAAAGVTSNVRHPGGRGGRQQLDNVGQASGSKDRTDLRRPGLGVPDDAVVDRNVAARRRAPSRIAEVRRASRYARRSHSCNNRPIRSRDMFDGKLFMTITQSTPRANPAIDSDPWLSVDQLLENYPFLQSSAPPGGEFTDSEDLGHFPQHDRRAGRLLLWRQSTIEAWLADS